jgi:predicted PurR-regulated permease PerM
LIEQGIASALASAQANASTLLRNGLTFLLDRITQILGVIGFVVGLLILPVWVFYLLNEQRRMLAFVNRMLNFSVRADVWHMVRIFDRSLSAYLRGQLTLGIIIGVAVGITLGIADLVPGIDIDYILILAIWAGICELVPMVGALLGMIPGVIVAAALGGPASAVVVAVIYIVIQQIENNVLVPRIIGDAVGVHPVVLTVTLLAGASLFGLPGVILAAPTTAIARDLYLYAYRRLGGASADEAMTSIS